MKKIFTLSIFLFVFGMFASAQLISTDFETWASGKPTGWFGSKTSFGLDSAIQDNVNFHGGASSIKFINPSTSHKRYSSTAVTVKKDTNYLISFWAKGNGNIRTGLFDGRATGSGYATYNSYVTVNSTTWVQYSQNMTAAVDTNVAQFILSIQSTSGGHLFIDDVTIGAAAPPVIDTVTIYQIQYTADTSGNSPKLGQTVRVKGIVTAAYASGYWMQDAAGPWHGVYVFDMNNKPAVGDSIIITAGVTEYNKLTELTPITTYTKLGVAANMPVPSVVTSAQVNTEAYEGVFIQVQNAKCTNINAGGGSWLINNSTATCKVDKTLFTFVPTLNVNYDVTGVGHYAFAEYKILPRSAADIVVANGISTSIEDKKLSIYPNPTTSKTTINSEKMMGKVMVFNLAGQMIESYTCNNSTQQIINTENLQSGVYFISVEFADNSKTTKRLIKN